VLDRHERRTHAEDDALDLVEEPVAALADWDDDADGSASRPSCCSASSNRSRSGMRAAWTRTVLDMVVSSRRLRIRNLP
jgi:hypothetical protein